MKEFYFAPRGSTAEILYLVEHWHVFEEMKERLGLPEPGLLLVPGQDMRICKEARERGIKVALDNGAFRLLKIDFDRPISLGDLMIEKWLHKWLDALKSCDWNWAALLDVPVHGKKFVDEKERTRRIVVTAELHRMAYRMAKDVFDPKRLRIVAQGFLPHEYELSTAMNLQVVEEHDPILALGSVCVRKDSSTTKLASGKARGTVAELLAVLDSKIVRTFFRGAHFFGLHGRFVKALRHHPMFFSADSGAAGAIFRWEIRDIKRKFGLTWKDRKRDYLLAHVIQYVRSTKRAKKGELTNLL